MFTINLFTLFSRLMHSRLAHSHEEQSNAWEGTVSARLGPLYLESNDAFVLDHSDVYLGIFASLPWRKDGRWQRYLLQIGFRACRGEEQVRQTGFEMLWQRPFFDMRSAQKN